MLRIKYLLSSKMIHSFFRLLSHLGRYLNSFQTYESFNHFKKFSSTIRVSVNICMLVCWWLRSIYMCSWRLWIWIFHQDYHKKWLYLSGWMRINGLPTDVISTANTNRIIIIIIITQRKRVSEKPAFLKIKLRSV